MVQWGQSNDVLDKLPSKEERFKLLDTLKEASEGKMFLEREYS
jgi:26S proteasome regulatory subunit N5